MSSPLIHILGGGRWQLPTIAAARRLGYRILVSDIYEDRPGYALADYHEVVDIRDREGTLAIARRHGINGIICDTTDVGVPTMAYVAETLGLPGIGLQTALRCTNKLLQRQTLLDSSVKQPRFSQATSAEDILTFGDKEGWPVVVKPVDSQSSRGVKIVRSPFEASSAFTLASSESQFGSVIVEAFLPGIEVTVEGFVVDGKVTVAAISDKDHYHDLPAVAWRLTYPADFSPSIFQKIIAAQTEAVTHIGLRTGVFHAEYMIVNDDPFLVELAARGGGSRIYTDILPRLANTDIVANYLQFTVTGKWGDSGALTAAPPQAANLFFLRFPAGAVPLAFKGLDEARAMPGMVEIDLEIGIGSPIPPVDNDRARHGYAVTLGESRESVLAIMHEILSLVSITTKAGTIVEGTA